MILFSVTGTLSFIYSFACVSGGLYSSLVLKENDSESVRGALGFEDKCLC